MLTRLTASPKTRVLLVAFVVYGALAVVRRSPSVAAAAAMFALMAAIFAFKSGRGPANPPPRWLIVGLVLVAGAIRIVPTVLS